MTQYSSFRPRAGEVTEEREKVVGKTPAEVNVFIPMVVVGSAVAAALIILLLLTKSQLSQISFEISALERELENLEITQEKLRVSHAEAYSLDRIEAFAFDELNMVRPNPDQIRYIDIDTVESNREEPAD